MYVVCYVVMKIEKLKMTLYKKSSGLNVIFLYVFRGNPIAYEVIFRNLIKTKKKINALYGSVAGAINESG